MTIPLERKPDSPERRRQSRSSLDLQISARERSRSAIATRMTSLSSFGAGIEGMVLVGEQVGAYLWLRLPGLESLSARLVWWNPARIGVEFETPLHPAVTARFLPRPRDEASATASDANPPAPAPLLSRREQIMAGIEGAERSPLLRRKQPSRLGLAGRIVRMIRRRADHRCEVRYRGGASDGALAIDGQPARVLDVSSSGMRIDAPLREKGIGESVAVRFEGFSELSGTVVWIKGDESGISLPPQSIELFERASH